MPGPGRFAVTSDTLTVAGAVPQAAETPSQAPPSTVMADRVQAREQVPPFADLERPAGGHPPLCREELPRPGRLSKKVPPLGATVRDTCALGTQHRLKWLVSAGRANGGPEPARSADIR